MLILFAIVTIFAHQLLCGAAVANTTDGDASSGCRYVRHFSFEGGNMTCPESAPVLASLQTLAPSPESFDGIELQLQLLPSTNWTMACDCPEWSLTNTDDTSIIFSEWKTYDVYTRVSGLSVVKCATNQYLSGLAFILDATADAYLWWGRCTNFSIGYTTREGMCWTSEVMLVQGSNGSLSLPGETAVMNGLRISYADYSVLYHMRWSYIFCLVLDVACPDPHIPDGYTDLSPPASDDEYLIGTTNHLSKSYNESLQIYCHNGYYLEGPNVASCQDNGEWTQLPTCRPCKSIKYCKVRTCVDGTSSRCLKCKPYTSTGYEVKLNRNGKKCRVVPYIHRKEITSFLFVYEPGDTIRMDCPSYGIPAPSLVWSSHTLNRSVAELINSSRLHFFKNGSLEITELTAQDEALYSCTASNPVGMDTIYILVVNELAYKFYLTPAAPQINQSSIILFFEANERAMFHCAASGAPTPRTQWYKLDNDRQYTVPPYGNLRILKLSNGSLSFAPILRRDSGRYACEAVNDYGHDLAMWIVCVDDSCGGTYSGGVDDPPPVLFTEYAPIIIHWKKVYIVKEGDSLSVPCVAGGNPPPAIEWRRGKEIISQNILNFQQVTVHDTGIYSCVARNRKGVMSREMAVIIDRRGQPSQRTATLGTSRATLTHSNLLLLTVLILLSLSCVRDVS